ncbi:MAG: glycoside hydrolase family 3 N-terminal domain-containing protein, partial [Bacteroidota bacterium]
MITTTKVAQIRNIFIILITTIFSFQLTAQDSLYADSMEVVWTDSVYNSLTVEERIAQLIFVRANYSGQSYLKIVDTLISKYNIGGVVFFKGDPVTQALQTNYWNSLAKTPLFVSIDAEWGLGMRLKNTLKYPLQMTLGAVSDNNLNYKMGQQIGEQCKRMGIHINFAPVIDVNSNPNNPVIGMRSFGQNPVHVAEKGNMYMLGMQSKGVIASAKHFPGHGNTYKDSHKDLPEVTSTLTTLVENDLLPFQYLIDEGVSSIMIAHLTVPALDNRSNIPTTLSHKIVTELLVDSMGFDGLIITDGLDMKGVTKYYKVGMVALKALQAGNDILLIPDNVQVSINNIKNAVADGLISDGHLERSCKKVLKYKYSSGAWKNNPIDTTNLISDLNQPQYLETANRLFSESVTIVKNDENILPIKSDEWKRKALLIVGTKKHQKIEDVLKQYSDFDIFSIEHNAKRKAGKKLLAKLKNYDLIVVAMLNTNILASRRFGITKSDVQLVEQIASNSDVVLDIFASPYALNFFNDDAFKAIIISYQEKPILQIASAHLIMKDVNRFGTLPVDAGQYKAGWGISYGATTLFNDNPESMGINLDILSKIDSTALNGIEIGAYPGCQIIAAKDG